MAKQIKETNVTKKKARKVDQPFAVKKGRVDAEQKTLFGRDLEDDFLDAFTNADFNIIDLGVVGDGDPMELMAPEGIEVISQTVRINAQGQAVVDVVLDLGPPAGATSYDIRIARRQQGTDLI